MAITMGSDHSPCRIPFQSTIHNDCRLPQDWKGYIIGLEGLCHWGLIIGLEGLCYWGSAMLCDLLSLFFVLSINGGVSSWPRIQRLSSIGRSWTLFWPPSESSSNREPLLTTCWASSDGSSGGSANALISCQPFIAVTSNIVQSARHDACMRRSGQSWALCIQLYMIIIIITHK